MLRNITQATRVIIKGLFRSPKFFGAVNHLPNRSISYKPQHQISFLKTTPKEIKFADLQKLFENGKFDDGVTKTQLYIKQKIEKFGEKYEGYESDTLLLAEFYNCSSHNDSQEKATKHYLESFELSIERENINVAAGAIKTLFVTWNLIQDIPGMAEKHEQLLSLIEKKEFPEEIRFQFLIAHNMIARESGDLTCRLISNKIQQLEDRLSSLQQKVEDKLETDEGKQSGYGDESTMQLIDTVLTINKAYQELCQISLLKRDFKEMMQHLDSHSKLLSKDLCIPDWLETIIAITVKEILHEYYLLTNQTTQMKANIDSTESYDIDKSGYSYIPFRLRNIEYSLLVGDLEAAHDEFDFFSALTATRSLSVTQYKEFEIDLQRLLCKFCLINNDTDGAEGCIQRCLNRLNQFGERPFRRIQIETLQSEVLEQRGDMQQAKEVVKNCIERHSKILGESSEQIQRLNLLLLKYNIQTMDEPKKLREITNLRERANKCFAILKEKGTFGGKLETTVNKMLDNVKDPKQ